ncbi:MAG: UDP-N-acetylmuramate--L-alanine ligase [Longimicrobiales bacterium]
MSSLRGPEELDLRAMARHGAIHFVGVAGAGMASLAELILRAGGRATGCDLRPGVVGETLRALGAEILVGHDPAHVADAVAVVTTAAVPQDHPELAAARARGIPVLKRAAALGALVNQGTVVAVAGTHGKTTTSAMATAILEEGGLRPTGFVGGRVGAWGSGLRSGAHRLFVVEADEYDRSFLTLRPDIAIVTTLEADHLDTFGSLEAVEEAFGRFIAPITAHGLLVAGTDDAGARRLLERFDGPTLGYGLAKDATLRATEVRSLGRGSRSVLMLRGQRLGELELQVPGAHNLRNALAALGAALHLDVTFEAAARALKSFAGVARRFQDLGEHHGVAVIDDYAHHPTEIEATLAAARGAFPERRLIAVFQPHLYSRTRDFAERFGQVLARADECWITDVYPAREPPIPGVTGELIANAARRVGGARVRYHPSIETLPDALVSVMRPGDVALCLGAGTITEAAHRIAALLEQERGGVTVASNSRDTHAREDEGSGGGHAT